MTAIWSSNKDRKEDQAFAAVKIGSTNIPPHPFQQYNGYLPSLSLTVGR
jgi:hypothetical protein